MVSFLSGCRTLLSSMTYAALRPAYVEVFLPPTFFPFFPTFLLTTLPALLPEADWLMTMFMRSAWSAPFTTVTSFGTLASGSVCVRNWKVPFPIEGENKACGGGVYVAPDSSCLLILLINSLGLTSGSLSSLSSSRTFDLPLRTPPMIGVSFAMYEVIRLTTLLA